MRMMNIIIVEEVYSMMATSQLVTRSSHHLVISNHNLLTLI